MFRIRASLCKGTFYLFYMIFSQTLNSELVISWIFGLILGGSLGRATPRDIVIISGSVLRCNPWSSIRDHMWCQRFKPHGKESVLSLYFLSGLWIDLFLITKYLHKKEMDKLLKKCMGHGLAITKHRIKTEGS